MNFVNLQEKNMNLLCLELDVSISSEVCSLAWKVALHLIT